MADSSDSLGTLRGEVATAVAGLGFEVLSVHALAGDASTRRFFRIRLVEGSSVVVTVYPEGASPQARRDADAQRWAVRAGLPVPSLLATGGRFVVSTDLGESDLERALREGDSDASDAILECLAAFQRTPWHDAPNPPFDAAFFRRELSGFEQHFASSDAISSFLDRLAGTVAGHPYRLAHRDFHLNNLHIVDGRVWTVDFQDLRGGPDTYDAASLLFERAAPELVRDVAAWAARAADLCGWEGSWIRRLRECRAQRGLKVLGTFARLAGERGRETYAAWLAVARQQTMLALRELESCPPELMRLLRAPHPAERL